MSRSQIPVTSADWSARSGRAAGKRRCLRAYALLVAVPVAAAATLAALSTHPLVRATGPLASAASTNAVDRVLAAVTAVVALAAGAGAVARRLGQPAVVGELAGGVVLGPTVLGAADPDVQHWLFPAGRCPR